MIKNYENYKNLCQSVTDSDSNANCQIVPTYSKVSAILKAFLESPNLKGLHVSSLISPTTYICYYSDRLMVKKRKSPTELLESPKTKITDEYHCYSLGEREYFFLYQLLVKLQMNWRNGGANHGNQSITCE